MSTWQREASSGRVFGGWIFIVIAAMAAVSLGQQLWEQFSVLALAALGMMVGALLAQGRSMIINPEYKKARTHYVARGVLFFGLGLWFFALNL
jgi:hypothetical protein